MFHHVQKRAISQEKMSKTDPPEQLLYLPLIIFECIKLSSGIEELDFKPIERYENKGLI
jgi:hypothetical protein